jgi:hypothetical protein
MQLVLYGHMEFEERLAVEDLKIAEELILLI